ncbi:hypothetical protein PILCRDRAFT_826849 [Piloderma croceum F 1598]|uniref:Uncharacterized protein n=1 Tax=Piloderma croceum (strain F 1598) TaxID=765440 RepID=A0A0C3BF95_PILCF|nr:hypothetical protein PILCRDRAFT_826849 [Piloderma croceum F 1598]
MALKIYDVRLVLLMWHEITLCGAGLLQGFETFPLYLKDMPVSRTRTEIALKTSGMYEWRRVQG